MNKAKESLKKITPSRLSFFLENTAVFLLGAVVYYVAEILYRGYSHITMFFAGGICFFLIYVCEKRMYRFKILYRCIIYAFMITSVEFVFGVVFNIMLGMQIWDYSEEPLNLFGQVCLGFVFMWMALAFPAVFLCKQIRGAFEKSRIGMNDNALDK